MPAICKLVRQERTQRSAEAMPGAQDTPTTGSRREVVYQPQDLRVHAVVGIQEAAMYLRTATSALMAARLLELALPTVRPNRPVTVDLP